MNGESPQRYSCKPVYVCVLAHAFPVHALQRQAVELGVPVGCARGVEMASCVGRGSLSIQAELSALVRSIQGLLSQRAFSPHIFCRELWKCQVSSSYWVCYCVLGYDTQSLPGVFNLNPFGHHCLLFEAITSTHTVCLRCLCEAHSPAYPDSLHTSLVSDAIANQSEWTFAKTPRPLTALYRKLAVPFSVDELLCHLRNVLETHEVNWQHVLSFVSTLLVYDAQALQLLSQLLNVAFESYDLENMITAFLLSRQGALEGPTVFPSYGEWFKVRHPPASGKIHPPWPCHCQLSRSFRHPSGVPAVATATVKSL
uniref:Fanconi anaemia group A protein N-terminal domain-containing protein n=1 Tax=Paramormyrops kingsleyae TaxID=1676925 RepID=A0A3B3RP75_9TELE